MDTEEANKEANTRWYLGFPDPKKLSSDEKVVFAFVVFIIQYTFLWIYTLNINSIYNLHEVVYNEKCENLVAWQCPRANLGCSSISPYPAMKQVGLTLRFMGGKVFLLESRKLFESEPRIPIGKPFCDSVWCQRDRMQGSWYIVTRVTT